MVQALPADPIVFVEAATEVYELVTNTKMYFSTKNLMTCFFYLDDECLSREVSRKCRRTTTLSSIACFRTFGNYSLLNLL